MSKNNYQNTLLATCEFRNLTQQDIPVIVASFTQIGWNKPAELFQKYLKEQENNTRSVWVVFNHEDFVGYATLKYHSDYQSFNTQNIPEINDLNVLPEFRNLGIGSKLLDLAEQEAQKLGSRVGLGVGLHADYGPAQKLYVKRGYILDGNGITYKNKPLKFGETVCLDDDLVLWFTKKLV